MKSCNNYVYSYKINGTLVLEPICLLSIRCQEFERGAHAPPWIRHCPTPMVSSALNYYTGDASRTTTLLMNIAWGLLIYRDLNHLMTSAEPEACYQNR